MIWVNISEEKSLFDVDEYKLGKNIMHSENVQDHGGKCNACNNRIEKCCRYICLSCRPGKYSEGGFVDLCEKCFDALNQNKKEEADNIIKKLKEHNHEEKKHLWLRVPFGNQYKLY